MLGARERAKQQGVLQEDSHADCGVDRFSFACSLGMRNRHAVEDERGNAVLKWHIDDRPLTEWLYSKYHLSPSVQIPCQVELRQGCPGLLKTWEGMDSWMLLSHAT